MKRASTEFTKIALTFVFFILIAFSSFATRPTTLESLIQHYKTNPQSQSSEYSILTFIQKNPHFYPDLMDLVKQGKSPNPAFALDTARMLIFSKRSISELNFASQILSKIPFSLIDTSEWIYLCQKIGHQGGDIMPCARRILDSDASQFSSISVLGADFKIGRDYALVYVLLSTHEAQWNRELGDRLWIGKDSESTQLALANALFYSVSLRSDVILNKIAFDYRRPKTLRERCSFLLQQIHTMETTSKSNPDHLPTLARHALNISWPTDEPTLRDIRRDRVQQISLQSLEQLEQLTFLLRHLAALRWDS